MVLTVPPPKKEKRRLRGRNDKCLDKKDKKCTDNKSRLDPGGTDSGHEIPGLLTWHEPGWQRAPTIAPNGCSRPNPRGRRASGVRMLDVMEFNKHQTQVLEWKW